MRGDIPVSVVIVTKNEAGNLPRCLSALNRFNDIWIVDSKSQDGSRTIAESYGAHFIDFEWNGQYPKKRQWCLDTLPLKHDFVFFVDADEEVTLELCAEIASLDFSCAGYFVKGAYVVDGKILRHGLKNSKLCLIDRRNMSFPIMDDLGIEGMGEIEGHYQPVLKNDRQDKIGRLRHVVLHHAYEDAHRYKSRHDGYRNWEEGVKTRGGNVSDPVLYRSILKRIFARVPYRDSIAFVHSYIILGGFMDGARGYFHAKSRYDYYARRND